MLREDAFFDGTDTIYNGSQIVRFRANRGFIFAKFEENGKEISWCPSTDNAEKIIKEKRSYGEVLAAGRAMDMISVW